MNSNTTIRIICLFVFGFLSFVSLDIKAQHQHQTEALNGLCKSWGLLKYYHPGIAAGKQNWDSVLVSSVGRILTSGTNDPLNTGPQKLNIEVEKMLNIAGKNHEPAHFPEAQEAINLRNLDHSWIWQNKGLNRLHKEALTFISKHPYQGLNYYAQPNPDNDSTVYTPNEKPYAEMKFPDVSYRLLGLFRFWNVIQYYYPYKYAIGRPWDEVLNELIPEMINAKDTLSYHKALAKMAASINDSHGGLWPQVFDTFTGKYSPSFDFRIVDHVAVVTRTEVSGQPSQISPGSVIEAIDGSPLKKRVEDYWAYVPASNNGGKLKSMHYFVLNSKKKTALLSGYRPDGSRFNVEVNLKKRELLKDYKDFFEMEHPTKYKMISDNIGYVFFSNINSNNLDSIMSPLKHTKAIIFDMRNYPVNGAGTYLVPQYLLKEPKIYSMLTRPDFSLPGTFKYEVANKGTNYSQVGKLNPEPYKGKIILLVDSRTQSAAEWACMTLKTATNVTVIGNQTAGADGNVTRTILPGGYRVNFSGLGIYYPDGSETQRLGIHVDIPVSYSISDIIYKRDPLLKRALEFIEEL